MARGSNILVLFDVACVFFWKQCWTSTASSNLATTITRQMPPGVADANLPRSRADLVERLPVGRLQARLVLAELEARFSASRRGERTISAYDADAATSVSAQYDGTVGSRLQAKHNDTEVNHEETMLRRSGRAAAGCLC